MFELQILGDHFNKHSNIWTLKPFMMLPWDIFYPPTVRMNGWSSPNYLLSAQVAFPDGPCSPGLSIGGATVPGTEVKHPDDQCRDCSESSLYYGMAVGSALALSTTWGPPCPVYHESVSPFHPAIACKIARKNWYATAICWKKGALEGVDVSWWRCQVKEKPPSTIAPPAPPLTIPIHDSVCGECCWLGRRSQVAALPSSVTSI